MYTSPTPDPTGLDVSVLYALAALLPASTLSSTAALRRGCSQRAPGRRPVDMVVASEDVNRLVPSADDSRQEHCNACVDLNLIPCDRRLARRCSPGVAPTS